MTILLKNITNEKIRLANILGAEGFMHESVRGSWDEDTAKYYLECGEIGISIATGVGGGGNIINGDYYIFHDDPSEPNEYSRKVDTTHEELVSLHFILKKFKVGSLVQDLINFQESNNQDTNIHKVIAVDFDKCKIMLKFENQKPWTEDLVFFLQNTIHVM